MVYAYYKILQMLCMQIIPAIDIRDGKCVRLSQGDYYREVIYNTDVVLVAKRLVNKGAKSLHIIDLDGAKQGVLCNLKTIQRVREAVCIPIQVGGGIRTLESIRILINLGINKVILGSVALDDVALLRQALADYRENIIVSLDAKGSYLMKKGWLEKADQALVPTILRLEKLGVRTMIFTDIERDGTLTEPNFKSIQTVSKITKADLIVAGGVSTIKHVQKLARIGVEGVIVGKALYEGAVDIKEANNVS